MRQHRPLSPSRKSDTSEDVGYRGPDAGPGNAALVGQLPLCGEQTPSAGETEPARDEAEWAEAAEFEAQHGSHDHTDLGGKHPVTVGQNTFTTGELNMLVDYVRSLNELRDWTPDDKVEGLALIEEMEAHGLSAEQTERFNTLFPHYDEIALENSDHFAPPSSGLAPAGSANFLGQIRKHFGDAHAHASQCDLNGALAIAGWGGHYVADAFSAGHLINKDEMMVEADIHLDAYGPQNIFQGAATQVMASCPDVSNWGIRTLFGVRALTADDLVQLYSVARIAENAVVRGAFAKAVHDRLAGNPGKPVIEVSSGGTVWKLGGDGNLDETSKRIVPELLDQAYEDLEAEAAQPGTISRSALLQKLEAGLPTPTAKGQALIDEIVLGVFDTPDSMMTALAEATSCEFNTIMTGFQDVPLVGDLIFVRHGKGNPGAGTGPTMGGLDDLLQTIGTDHDSISSSMEDLSHMLDEGHDCHASTAQLEEDEAETQNTLTSDIDALLAMLAA